MGRKLDNQEEKLPKKKKEENCWVGIQQKCYMAGTTRSLTRNIGDGVRGQLYFHP